MKIEEITVAGEDAAGIGGFLLDSMIRGAFHEGTQGLDGYFLFRILVFRRILAERGEGAA
jgi:hypothetical protein